MNGIRLPARLQLHLRGGWGVSIYNEFVADYFERPVREVKPREGLINHAVGR